MNAPLRCNCDECRRLDKLPTRKQGWPGCYQLLLPDTANVAQIDWPEVEPYQPTGPSQKSVDALPLFGGGSDEPFLI